MNNRYKKINKSIRRGRGRPRYLPSPSNGHIVGGRKFPRPTQQSKVNDIWRTDTDDIVYEETDTYMPVMTRVSSREGCNGCNILDFNGSDPVILVGTGFIYWGADLCAEQEITDTSECNPNDIQFLQDFIDNSQNPNCSLYPNACQHKPDVNLNPFDLGWQLWEDGRLKVFRSNGAVSSPYRDLEQVLFNEIPESIGNVEELEYIDVSWNALNDSIPVSITNLTNLKYLGLYSNQLSGPIPTNIGNLTNLTHLNLSGHNGFYFWGDTNPMQSLSGYIPNSILNLTNLVELNLQNNMLEGVFPGSPGCMDNSYNLEFFNIISNRLCEPYPECPDDVDIYYQGTWYNQSCSETNCPSEYELDGVCLDVGDIQTLEDFVTASGTNMAPINFGWQTWSNGRLTSLNCQSCTTANYIPESLGNLTALEFFSYQDNDCGGCNIPDSIGNLTNLRTLRMQSNELGGQIPESICNCPIEQVWFNSNNLEGYIPNCICEGWNITNWNYNFYIDFAVNNLCPPYPECIGGGSFNAMGEPLGCDGGLLPGDVNEDGTLNVLDVVTLVDMILAVNPDETPVYSGEQIAQLYPQADIDGDGLINVLDIVQMIQLILNNPTTSSRDRKEIQRQLDRLQ